ncbi:MAG: hypothetical protein K5986_12335, partial [Clostridium sp.]|nr:hypothetical protein [Clostridium sp.]
MKIGMRKPSLKKSFKARTTGKMKRKGKKAINPLYGKKGMGWINDPKKAAYNKVYHKTTFGVNDIMRTASSGTSSSKKSKKVAYSSSNKKNIKEDLKLLDKEYNVNTKILSKYHWDAIISFIFIFSNVLPFILIGFVLAIHTLVKMSKREYRTASRWHYALKLYLLGEKDRSRKYISRLPEEEKVKEEYKRFINLLDGISIEVEEKITDIDEISPPSVDDYYAEKVIIKNEKIKYSDKVYDEFIVVDTETTGLDCSVDKIIEISALKYKDGKLIQSFEKLINPEIPIPEFITNINNITNDMVKDSETIDKVMPEFLSFLGDSPLVAHNAKFDIRYINANLVPLNKKIENEVIDTLTLSRYLYKDIENHKLPTIKKYLNMDLESHRASTDCMVCAEIYLDYCRAVKENSYPKEAEELEKQAYDVVKDILIRNNMDMSYFKAAKKGVYLDFTALYSFLRIKLNGKKQYVLTNMEEDGIEELGLTYEVPSKSENYKSRVNF